MNVSGQPLLVTADDSTGATEAGALCADAGWSVSVVPFGSPVSSDPCVVVDLRSRHLTGAQARQRVRAVTGPHHKVHKIDSTLRGNWAAELAEIADGGRRILLVPAHPRAGRVCRGGLVYVDGVLVHETAHGADPRLPVRSSRPAEQLSADELGDAGDVAGWVARRGTSAAVVDASTAAEIDRIVAVALATPEVLLAGPASIVEAVARQLSTTVRRPLPRPWLPDPLVVVCASLHPVSRDQIARLEEGGVEVVASSMTRRGDPEAVARQTAQIGQARVDELHAKSVLLIGGDTAEAFIGGSVVHMFGSLDVGVSLGEAEIDGRLLRVAAKNGGFGTSDTLVHLLVDGRNP